MKKKPVFFRSVSRAGLVQKSVDFAKFYFDNQWADAGFDMELPTGENYDAQQISYPDVNAGISYSYNASEKFSFYSGIALYHLSKPSDSFYGNMENRLGIRPSANAGAVVMLNDQVFLYPSLIYMSQKKAHEFLAGSMISYTMNTASSNQLFGGIFARFGDAIIPAVGYQYERWRAILNYDVNISSLKAASGGKGAFELSIVYTGWYKKPRGRVIDLPCPRF